MDECTLVLKDISHLQHTDIRAYFSRYGTLIRMTFLEKGRCFIQFSSPTEADMVFNDGAFHSDVDGTLYRQHCIKNVPVLLSRIPPYFVREKGNVSNHSAGRNCIPLYGHFCLLFIQIQLCDSIYKMYNFFYNESINLKGI